MRITRILIFAALAGCSGAASPAVPIALSGVPLPQATAFPKLKIEPGSLSLTMPDAGAVRVWEVGGQVIDHCSGHVANLKLVRAKDGITRYTVTPVTTGKCFVYFLNKKDTKGGFLHVAVQ